MLKYFVIAAVLGSSVANACPQINGEFIQKTGTDSFESISLNMRQESGVPSYSFGWDSPYFPADGQIHRQCANGQCGQVKVSCSDNVVDIDMQSDAGTNAGIHIEKTGENTLHVTGRAQLSDTQGTYIRR